MHYYKEWDKDGYLGVVRHSQALTDEQIEALASRGGQGRRDP